MELATLGSTFCLLYLIQKKMICLKSKSNIQTDSKESTYDAVLFCTHLLEIETAFNQKFLIFLSDAFFLTSIIRLALVF